MHITFLTVVVRMESSSASKLYRCHTSSESSACILTVPAPFLAEISFLMILMDGKILSVYSRVIWFSKCYESVQRLIDDAFCMVQRLFILLCGLNFLFLAPKTEISPQDPTTRQKIK